MRLRLFVEPIDTFERIRDLTIDLRLVQYKLEDSLCPLISTRLSKSEELVNICMILRPLYRSGIRAALRSRISGRPPANRYAYQREIS